MPGYVCSICGRPAEYTGRLPRLYPFCSDRCKMIDLGRWFNEEYTIDRDLTADEAPESSDIADDRS